MTSQYMKRKEAQKIRYFVIPDYDAMNKKSHHTLSGFIINKNIAEKLASFRLPYYAQVYFFNLLCRRAQQHDSNVVTTFEGQCMNVGRTDQRQNSEKLLLKYQLLIEIFPVCIKEERKEVINIQNFEKEISKEVSKNDVENSVKNPIVVVENPAVHNNLTLPEHSATQKFHDGFNPGVVEIRSYLKKAKLFGLVRHADKVFATYGNVAGVETRIKEIMKFSTYPHDKEVHEEMKFINFYLSCDLGLVAPRKAGADD